MSGTEIDDTLIANALDRIARTPDGAQLYLLCQKTLTGVPLGNPTTDALQAHHGRRTFAAELMAKMAAGIKDSHGGRDPTDSPITFADREPVRVAGRDTVRNFIARTDPELNPGPSKPAGGAPGRAA